MSKDLYAQRGWLLSSLDQLAGIKDAEKLCRKARSISDAANRPTWVKEATVEKFATAAARMAERLKP